MRRRWLAILAVFAVLLQAAAPLAIAPPRGQAVHFAHSHQGEDGAAGNDHADSGRPDSGACPVCQALQAGGAGIAAPAIVLTVRCEAAAPATVLRADPPAAEPSSSHRARAPPTGA